MEAEVASEWEKDFYTALNVILSFDLVLVTEWLHEPAQCSWFRKILDIDTDMHAFNTQHMKGDYDEADRALLLPEDIQLLFEVGCVLSRVSPLVALITSSPTNKI